MRRLQHKVYVRAICEIRAIRANRTIENSLIRRIVLRKSAEVAGSGTGSLTIG